MLHNPEPFIHLATECLICGDKINQSSVFCIACKETLENKKRQDYNVMNKINLCYNKKPLHNINKNYFKPGFMDNMKETISTWGNYKNVREEDRL